LDLGLFSDCSVLQHDNCMGFLLFFQFLSSGLTVVGVPDSDEPDGRKYDGYVAALLQRALFYECYLQCGMFGIHDLR